MANLPTETLLLLGVVVFEVVSVLTGILDGYFSKFTPYIYQVASFVGFAQLYIISFTYSIQSDLYLASSIFYVAIALLLLGRSVKHVYRKRDGLSELSLN